MDYLEFVKDNCIKCGLCTDNCPFLSKYSINLLDYTNREDLAYSCFLCNKCSDVCPKNLNGKYISLTFRKNNPKYKLVKLNKESYPFRNLPKKTGLSKDLLFLGCNFPAFYPETSKSLINLFKENGFTFSIDCCKNPVASTGFKEDPIQSLEDQIKNLKIDRIVTACPNCYHHMAKKYDAEVISIFKWLEEYDYIKDINQDCDVFFPCSDRYNREIFEVIKRHAPNWNDKFTSTNCCGAGGLASKKEKEIADDMTSSIKNEEVYTYCATCSMRFSKYNKVHHFASVFLGIDEEVKTDYFKNALKAKFYN
ncbi:heterodisulfide reductase-related iron-sulfur binding cluster [Anaerococcus cruorum]|uniref:heterodisulfide reductase-related iron-sulfur binding cluster n=1 Tax=Anaerococcus sp. WGS1529 TaxID=3366812 RepID=UPI00372D1733